MGINEDMKKVLLAGIGAVATSFEKSADLVDQLIKKGELTVEQGKILNEELKRKSKEKAKETKEEQSVLERLDQLNDEELAAIKLKLAELEQRKNEEKGRESTTQI